MAVFKPESLVVYKHKPAIVKEAGEKITIAVLGGETLRVREKDIALIHPGPAANLSGIGDSFSQTLAREVWELYVDEDAPLTLKDLAEFLGAWTAQNAWHAFLILSDNFYFEGDPQCIRPKPRAAVDAEQQKRDLRSEENASRQAFLERLHVKKLLLPDDLRFLQDVEALAQGKTEKSRTLKEAHLAENAETAHLLLLETGVWDPFVNPYPLRYGVALNAPKAAIAAPPLEDRVDLTHLASFAIDDEGNTDPDDALSLEKTADGTLLYVHIADPSSSILSGSPADREARERGATLYLPEKTIRMLDEEALKSFALGIEAVSPALTFKIELDENVAIKKTDIFRSLVTVERLTYEAASDNAILAPFFELMAANIRRRNAAGAVQIDFPEVRFAINPDDIQITPLENYPSRALVRECMLLAGEAAAEWALKQRIAFPYISQETENTGSKILPGYAGAFQLRRGMRSRVLSVKPGLHQGLGLDIYTHVTSPLRRYTDLLAHEQISAVLRGTAPLDEEQLLAHLAVSERAALAVTRAERSSRAHWTAVYLSGKIGQQWEGIILDMRPPHAVVLVPALGIEVQTALKRDAGYNPNDTCTLKLANVHLPQAQTRWLMV